MNEHIIFPFTIVVCVIIFVIAVVLWLLQRLGIIGHPIDESCPGCHHVLYQRKDLIYCPDCNHVKLASKRG